MEMNSYDPAVDFDVFGSAAQEALERFERHASRLGTPDDLSVLIYPAIRQLTIPTREVADPRLSEGVKAMEAVGDRRSRREAAAGALAKENGGRLAEAAARLRQRAEEHFRPIRIEDVAYRFGEGTPILWDEELHVWASVLLLLAEAVLHPEDPLKRTFTWGAGTRRSRPQARKEPWMRFLEEEFCRTLQPLDAADAYELVCSHEGLEVSRLDFLEWILNLGRDRIDWGRRRPRCGSFRRRRIRGRSRGSCWSMPRPRWMRPN